MQTMTIRASRNTERKEIGLSLLCTETLFANREARLGAERDLFPPNQAFIPFWSPTPGLGSRIFLVHSTMLLL